MYDNLDSCVALSHNPGVMISRYSKRIHNINRADDSGSIKPDGRIESDCCMSWKEYMEDLKRSSCIRRCVRYAKWKFKHLKCRTNLLYKARKDAKNFDKWKHIKQFQDFI